MSSYDYRHYRRLAHSVEAPYYGLLFLLFSQSDSENLERLKAAFPERYEEYRRRYNAPGGWLSTDPEMQPGHPEYDDEREALVLAHEAKP